MIKGGGNASLFWMLAGARPTTRANTRTTTASTVYNNGDETARLLTQYARQYRDRRAGLPIRPGRPGAQDPAAEQVRPGDAAPGKS